MTTDKIGMLWKTPEPVQINVGSEVYVSHSNNRTGEPIVEGNFTIVSKPVIFNWCGKPNIGFEAIRVKDKQQ
jgi:hypothetical protein